jgi:hypothetical protein
MGMTIGSGIVRAYGGAPPASLSAITWTDTYSKTGTPAPGTSETVDIGTASSDRVVVLAIGSYGAADNVNMDITTATIGGNSATLAAAMRDAGGSFPRLGTLVFYLNVPSGATASVVIGGYTNGWVEDYTVDVGYFTGSATASHASEVEVPIAIGNQSPASITVPTNGVVLCVGRSDRNTSDPTHVWNGATEWATEHGNGDPNWQSCAYLTTSGNVDVDCTNFNISGMLAARFQP